MLPLHRNPLIYRHWCVFSRPGRFWSWITALVVLLLLGALYVSLREPARPAHERYADAAKVYCVIILLAQIFIAFYISLGATLDSIVTEKSRNSYEFFATLPISPLDKAVGLSVGCTLQPMLFIILLVPIGIISGLEGGFSLTGLLWLYVLIFAGFFAFSITGVAVSNSLGRHPMAWILVSIYLLLSLILFGIQQDSDGLDAANFTAVPWMALSPFSLLPPSLFDHADLLQPPPNTHFFSLTVPWQVCPLVFYLFLGCASLSVAVQSLSGPAGRPLPAWAILLLSAIFHFLLVGFLADLLRSNPGGCLAVMPQYLGIFLVLVLIWAIANTPAYDHLMEWVEKPGPWPLRILSQSFTDSRTPPFILTALLWLLATGAVICIDALYWHRLFIPAVLVIALVILLFIWAYQVLYLLGRQLSRRSGRLLGLVFVLAALAVPLVFTTISDFEWLIHATPLGVIVTRDVLVDSFLIEGSHVPDQVYFGLTYAAGMLVVFGLLSAWRFNSMLAISPLGRRRLPAATMSPKR